MDRIKVAAGMRPRRAISGKEDGSYVLGELTAYHLAAVMPGGHSSRSLLWRRSHHLNLT